MTELPVQKEAAGTPPVSPHTLLDQGEQPPSSPALSPHRHFHQANQKQGMLRMSQESSSN